MKKSLLALAVLGAFAGAASAQSSVTVFGVVDAAVRDVRNSGFGDVKKLESGGWNSSRLGFRGVEDLGGGLKAGFWLEHGFNIDNGAQSSSTSFWNRRSTVSLLGNFGEVRLGRDYSPTFWQVTGFDVFNYGGIGGISNFLYAPISYGAAGKDAGDTAATTLNSGAHGDRNINNAVSYFLPSGIGGLYGQLTAAAGEGVAGQRYEGGRLGYAAGPIDVSALYSQGRGVTNGTTDKLKVWGVGGSYNFGVAKVLAQYLEQKYNPAKQKLWEIAGVVPLGLGEIHASYIQSKLSGTAALDPQDGRQYAIGYAYNLSKRTALYANVARLDNSGNSSNGGTLTVNSANTLGITPGGNSTGYEVGIRHSF
jgi:predicted porin